MARADYDYRRWTTTTATAHVMEEIRALVAAGDLPATVGGFADLHDHLDANALLPFDVVAGDEDGRGHAASLDLANAVIAAVDAAIKAGGLTAAAGETCAMCPQPVQTTRGEMSLCSDCAADYDAQPFEKEADA